MFTGRFDPKQRAVQVAVRVFGPNGDLDLRFILDTGTPVTLIDPEFVDRLGYSARMATGRTRLVGVDGIQEDYRLKVERLEALGFAVDGCDLFCHDFDESLAIDGLIGMDLLEGRVLTLDGIEGTITVAP